LGRARCVKGDPVELLPWLYIGNAYHASCPDRLTAHGISALLNMADAAAPAGDDVTSPLTTGVKKDVGGLSQVHVAVSDNCTADINQCFPQAVDFIGEPRC